MAPKRGESIERNHEYDEFIKKLQIYHDKRGTTLEPEPKVGIRHIDLLKLYTRVVNEGGYDLCSDTKAKPLMWRKFAEEFIGKNAYLAAQAFQVKQIYYRNLVAYEITEHWKQEPPPKEILEEVSAKGGNVMGRTLENFERPATKEEKAAASPEQTTPTKEKTEPTDDPGSAAGRRGLRQQPSQRQLYQPETKTKAAAIAPQYAATPGAQMNGYTNGTAANAASSTLASYEPSQSYPLSLKPVVTPANNPEHYRNDRKRKLEAMAAGTGFIGPNIYVRAQMALQSGMPDEERYALHHLVKISHERGDKYRFDQFPGLAEVLAKKILCASSLFYGVSWDVSYEDDSLILDDETLDGISGTADIIAKLKARPLPVNTNDVLDGDFLDLIGRVTEASLVFRNMCTLDDNARYAASIGLIRDVIAITLSLPEHWVLTEVRHNMLDIAEFVLKFCDVDTQEDLYASLVTSLNSRDRGTVVLAMRVISRLSMTLPPPKQLELIEPETLRRTHDWLMIEDEELRGACLDFLMQYTTFADNVKTLLESVDGESLARQLGRLLLFDAKEHRQPVAVQKLDVPDLIPPVPRLSKLVVNTLLKLDEPARSSEWLRMCFLPDPNSEMTQISLWQAYQGTFGPYSATHGNLIAGEFIKNVSTVFQGATAQVAGQNKYVIRGIRSRKVPIESEGSALDIKDKGNELVQCRWHIARFNSADPAGSLRTKVPCNEWFRRNRELTAHILADHLALSPNERPKIETNGEAMDVDSKPGDEADDKTEVKTELKMNGVLKSDLTTQAMLSDIFDLDRHVTDGCEWAGCGRKTGVDGHSSTKAGTMARHIQTHLPDASTAHQKYNVKPDEQSPAAYEPLVLSIMVDEKMDAAALPLGAALVLSHIARFMPGSEPAPKNEEVEQVPTSTETPQKKETAESLLEQIFGREVKERMFYALAHCPPARAYVGSILNNIRRSGG